MIPINITYIRNLTERTFTERYIKTAIDDIEVGYISLSVDLSSSEPPICSSYSFSVL